jgi:hypothetical protein
MLRPLEPQVGRILVCAKTLRYNGSLLHDFAITLLR